MQTDDDGTESQAVNRAFAGMDLIMRIRLIEEILLSERPDVPV